MLTRNSLQPPIRAEQLKRLLHDGGPQTAALSPDRCGREAFTLFIKIGFQWSVVGCQFTQSERRVEPHLDFRTDSRQLIAEAFRRLTRYGEGCLHRKAPHSFAVLFDLPLEASFARRSIGISSDL
jgi:hypothetical protein